MKTATALFLAAMITALPISASAEKENLEELLGGFEEETEAEKETGPEETVKEKPWELNGAVTVSSSYNYAHKTPATGETDYRDLSRLKTELQLDLEVELPRDWKFFASGRGFYDFAYTINGRNNYTKETLDEYENELEFRDFYLQGSLAKNLDLKSGRQIVVWGKSDSIRVTDVLNPTDNREPGMVDMEDLRLPVSMTRLDYYFGDWNLTAIVIHETRLPKNPPVGSEFYPLPFPPPPEDAPTANSEYAAALNGIFSGWDISFYYARLFDDQTHIEIVPATLQMVRRHSPLSMAGAAVTVAAGNWLLKAEAALFDGLEFFNLPGGKKSRSDLLIGVEYSGFTDTGISLEAVNRRINGFDEKLKGSPDFKKEDEFATALRFNRDFMNDTVHLVALVLTFGGGGEDGGVQRFSVKYDVTDDYSVTGGLVAYQPGKGIPFGKWDDNDRLFIDFKYSF